MRHPLAAVVPVLAFMAGRLLILARKGRLCRDVTSVRDRKNARCRREA